MFNRKLYKQSIRNNSLSNTCQMEIIKNQSDFQNKKSKKTENVMAKTGKINKRQTTVHKSHNRKQKPSNNNAINNQRKYMVIRKCKLILLHMWQPLCCFSKYKSCDQYNLGSQIRRR